MRRALGLAYSAVQRDSLSTLRVETEQLGSAAVESTAYVGAELRAIDDRLTRLEDELVALRRLLEERAAVGGHSD
ncbi:MAG: hypothetical protein QOD60_2594 [Solirubrobacterales bacterium]|nr:hypothetical protein [Solirubrobacterales bacterium]